MEGEFEVYKSGLLRRGWRWRFVAKNGRIIYGSTESYKNLADCLDTIPILQGETEAHYRFYA